MNYLTRYNCQLNDLDQEFKSLLTPGFFSPWITSEMREQLSPSFRLPKYQIHEESDHYLLICEMPGASKDNIKIEVKNDELFIEGEVRSLSKKKDLKNTKVESSRKFQRSFTLPAGTQEDKIQAQCEDGILQIHLPKAEKKKSKLIQIKEPGTSKVFKQS